MTYHDHWTDTNGLETEFVPMTDHHPVTDKELREMRKRAENATPGPWIYDDGVDLNEEGEPEPKHPPGVVAKTESGSLSEVAQCDGYGESRDALFIAHARTDVPRLVADCERYRALLRQLEEVMDEQPMWLRAICEALGETDNPNPKEIQP